MLTGSGETVPLKLVLLVLVGGSVVLPDPLYVNTPEYRSVALEDVVMSTVMKMGSTASEPNAFNSSWPALTSGVHASVLPFPSRTLTRLPNCHLAASLLNRRTRST